MKSIEQDKAGPLLQIIQDKPYRTLYIFI